MEEINNFYFITHHSDTSVSDRCPEPREVSRVSRRAAEEQHRGIPAAPASQSVSSGAQLKHM